MLAEVIRMHPIVVYGEEVIRNEVFYRSPRSRGAGSDDIEEMLQGLLAHHRVHRALEEAEERFRTAIDLLPSAYCLFDSAGRFTYVNREALRLIGKHRDELLGRDIKDAWDGDLALSVASGMREAADDCAAVAVRSAVDEPGGGRRDLQSYITPVYDEDGHLTMFLVVTSPVAATS